VVRVIPPESARVRIFFHADARSPWYSVALKPEAGRLVAILPRPQKTLRQFSYYVEITDAALKSGRTEEYTTKVVAGANECTKEMMGLSTATASVLLEVPSGAAAVPAGFSSAGVVTLAGAPVAAPAAGVPASAGPPASVQGGASGVAGSGGGTGAGASTSTSTNAGAGGGMGTAALVGAGAVVAGGAAVVLTGDGDGVIGTWDGTRTVDNGPLFANCTRVFNEHWVITQTGSSLHAQVESMGQSCGTPTCGQGCSLFPFPWNMDGSLDGGTARFVVYGGTQCILSLKLYGDRLSGSMSSCNESPGMTQDVVLVRTAK
jgi:hypothetical protein